MPNWVTGTMMRKPVMAWMASILAHGYLGGDPTSKRTSHQMHAGEIDLIEKIQVEIRGIADSLEPVRGIRRAKSRMVGDDDVEILRQCIEIAGRVGERILASQKHQNRSTSETAIADRCTSPHKTERGVHRPGPRRPPVRPSRDDCTDFLA